MAAAAPELTLEGWIKGLFTFAHRVPDPLITGSPRTRDHIAALTLMLRDGRTKGTAGHVTLHAENVQGRQHFKIMAVVRPHTVEKLLSALRRAKEATEFEVISDITAKPVAGQSCEITISFAPKPLE